MHKLAGIGVFALAILALGVGAGFAAEVPATHAAKQRLKADLPQVRFYESGQRVGRVYGQPLAFGAIPEESAERFRVDYAELFGVRAEDLAPQSRLRDNRHTTQLMYDPQTGQYKFTLVYYRHYKDGLPVFRSDLRLLVRNEPNYPLVLAASSLKDLGNFGVAATERTALENPQDVETRFAVAKDSAKAIFPDLLNFTRPERVVWAGINDFKVKPRVALAFIGDNFLPDWAGDQKWLFLADFETGEILHHEPMIFHADGNVSGLSTEGIGADICEAESPISLPYLRVTSGANEAFTDANGDYSIVDDGTVEASLDGQWFDVFNFQGAEVAESVAATFPADIEFNSANTDEFVRAQVNNYVHANIVRDFILQQNPSYPTFTDTNIPAWANRTDGFCPGNAWYDPADGGSPTGYSINFCSEGPSNPNTSWSSVVYHEFGHHLVQAGGSGQGQYGEGTGDVMSVVILDDPNVGLGFFNSCATTLRSAVNTLQYPCSGTHACAPLYSGAVWDTRNALINTEPVNYSQILGNLAVNSVLMHSGSEITPQMTIDWLTLDDDDANIDNGTPHRTEICTGFDAHNLTCPVLPIGLSVFPTASFDSAGEVGGPFTPGSKIYTIENLGPGSFDYNVTTTANWLTITDGSGTLANVSDTAPVTIAINANANSLPAGRQTAILNFINLTDGVGDTTRTVKLAVGIPDLCTSAAAVCLGPVSDSTVGMTSDGTSSCGDSNSSPDLWYAYTPDSNGTATFSLCTGTGYDAVLSVHSGCPGTAANDLGCDDDGCGSTGGPATVTVSVTANTTYLIRVTGWQGSAGSFTLTVTGPGCAPEALSISFPNGLPDEMPPGAATSFDVQIIDGDETFQPGTARLNYRYDGGPFQTAALTPLGGDLFEATLPAADCSDTPEFYVSAQSNLGTTVTSPADAPASFYSTFVGTSTIIVDDDFEIDLGWTVSGSPGDGQWTRGVPIAQNVCDRGNPPSDADGSGQCWVTDNDSANACNSDVDSGTTILTSPLFDISSGGTIEYSYWADDGPGVFDNDSLDVEVATDAGSTNWTTIRSYTTPLPAWRTDTIDVGTEVAPSSTIRLRFLASDLGAASLIEAGVDALLVRTLECVSGPTCSDGIQNQSEDRIDCGGPCPACQCTTDGTCDDTAFCTGTESCDAFGTCQSGSAPCGGSTWCDEDGDNCVAYGDGDFEPDGDHDLNDFAKLQECFGQLGLGACQPANMTGSGTVELDDYALFEAALDGLN